MLDRDCVGLTLAYAFATLEAGLANGRRGHESGASRKAVRVTPPIVIAAGLVGAWVRLHAAAADGVRRAAPP
jgi:hypothetical protein